MADLALYIKEGESYRHLNVPQYFVKDLLRDRLSDCEIKRLNRLASATKIPDKLPQGSVIIDFSKKQALCHQAGFLLSDLDLTWKVDDQESIIKAF